MVVAAVIVYAVVVEFAAAVTVEVVVVEFVAWLMVVAAVLPFLVHHLHVFSSLYAGLALVVCEIMLVFPCMSNCAHVRLGLAGMLGIVESCHKQCRTLAEVVLKVDLELLFH